MTVEADSSRPTTQAHATPQYDEATRLIFSDQYRHRAFLRGPEWRDSNFYDLSNPYPKYYGAFHYNIFSRTGVAPGDVGFRGNSIIWSPWD